MPEAISETYSGSATKSGLTVDVAVTVPSSPGERGVTVRVRVRTARGGAVGGYIVWSGSPLDPGSPDVGPFGDVHTQNPDGCDPAPTPDPNAGPVDLSFDLTHTYGARPASYTVKVLAYSSACYAERAVTEVAVPITLR